MCSSQEDSRQLELEELMRTSPEGVIHLSTDLFDRYLLGKRRPYSVILFMTASHLLDKQQLDLRGQRKEFGLLAKVRSPPAAAPSHHMT